MKSNGEHIWFSGNLMTLLHTDGWTLLTSHMRAGHAPPLHIHRGEDEGFYLLSGSMIFQCGEEIVDLQAGSSLVVAKGVPHAFLVGEAGARAIQIATGPALAEFIRAAGVPALTAELPDPGPIDHDAIAHAAERHDMLVVGPPLRPNLT